MDKLVSKLMTTITATNAAIECDADRDAYVTIMYLHDHTLYKMRYKYGEVCEFDQVLYSIELVDIECPRYTLSMSYIVSPDKYSRVCRVCDGHIEYTCAPFECYADFLDKLAAGRKYHEHAGNVYIAATAWRFKYPGDCAIKFVE